MKKVLKAEDVRRATREAAKERRKAILALHKEHGSHAQVARILGVSRQRVAILVEQARRD
jgi:DNA-directed RNA polymerase specialized sigma24 family protein